MNDSLAIIDIFTGCKIANRIAGRDRASDIRHRCQTAPTGLCRAMPCSIVKAAALYTNWLAPGFNIDSRKRVYSERQKRTASVKIQTASVHFRLKAVESERELTSTPNNSYGTLAKTIKTINCSFLPPSYVYLTWLAMRLVH
jgi:hypothetical protein